MEKDYYWVDKAAEKIIKEKGNKKEYVCASGITPSGTVHIGNFREIITTDLIVKGLENKGKKVRFIYSWDDYDRFRKVPKNVNKKWEKYLGMPLSDIPDPFGCCKSYAEHFEKELEDSIKDLGFKINFIYQNKMYKKCVYAKEIKIALDNKNEIIKILNKYRNEPLEKDWLPLVVYCEKCGKESSTKILDYDNYRLNYECGCGYSNEIDFRKKGVIKLTWRVDWPMRWNYEKVDFEPGGKDHSTVGGSFDTGKQIVKKVWKRDAPTYLMYDFVRVKGGGGKISSSFGDVVTIKDVSEIYEPNVLRWLFVGTRPGSEFAISFDLDVIKLYEDFDRCERIYFDKEKVNNEKDLINQKRIYELSCVRIPKKYVKKDSFRHLSNLVQINEGDLSKIKNDRAKYVWNWIQRYAPDEFKFSVHKVISKEIKELLNEKQKKSLKMLVKSLEKKSFNEQSLFDEFYKICKAVDINNIDFFEGAYLGLIGKKRGPKLAGFILTLGKRRVIELLKNV